MSTMARPSLYTLMVGGDGRSRTCLAEADKFLHKRKRTEEEVQVRECKVYNVYSQYNVYYRVHIQLIHSTHSAHSHHHYCVLCTQHYSPYTMVALCRKRDRLGSTPAAPSTQSAPGSGHPTGAMNSDGSRSSSPAALMLSPTHSNDAAARAREAREAREGRGAVGLDGAFVPEDLKALHNAAYASSGSRYAALLPLISAQRRK